MPKYIIQGPAKLAGEIQVKGAKNAILKIIPAALLSREKIIITNVPQIEDVERALEVAEDLGAKIKRDGDRLEIQVEKIVKKEIIPALANKFRASIMFAGPILARVGEVKFPHPGGCVIGAGKRPIDLFIEGFKALGAKAEEKDDHYHIKGKLKGGEYFFTTVSVTVTESMMMTACLADGITTLKNCAMEPEITALADYLNTCGAKIKGAGTSTMTIEGVKELHAGEIAVIPDRIETGTFAIMAAATKSEIKITHCNPEHIENLLTIFDRQGIKYEKGADWLLIKKTDKILPYSIKTHEYPGFPTDLQSPYVILATQADGSSLIHETIYDRRLLWTDMLTQMGADIVMCDPHRVVVNGKSKLYGRKLVSPDLRAGIAMVIAGMIADGKTEIDNIYQIERGYEGIVDRLKALGAEIEKID